MKSNRLIQKEILVSLNAMPAHKVGSQWEADRLTDLANVTSAIRAEEAGAEWAHRSSQSMSKVELSDRQESLNRYLEMIEA